LRTAQLVNGRAQGDLLDSGLTMGALAAVERFLERLFEGQSARLFHTRLRPLQVQRRIERAMESGRVRDGGRTIVPHRLVVRIAPDDLTALRTDAPGLAASLADGALAFARAHGYTLLDRPTVTLRPDQRIERGAVLVDVAMAPDLHDGADSVDGAAAAAAAGSEGEARLRSVDSDASIRDRSLPPAEATAVFVVPRSDGPRATIREIRADRSSRTIELEGRALTIGRAPDNGLVLRDGRASRHHARIDTRRGSLVLTDLGSTNGSWVNDRRVESVALGEGDRLRIGTTTLVIESVEAGGRQGDAGPPA
jgi:Protein of unknown function (DUF3662)/Inner membrane component of T3SS, cytoplasmic domain